jgi:hypothetical protein
MRKDGVYFREDNDILKRAPRKDEDYGLERERTKERIIKQGLPRMEDSKLETLKLKSSKVIGSIFDRIIFLETRINELNEALELRKKLHIDMIKNIETDIQDKENMAMLISDQNEKRNLKMDISILRKEKRHEQLQFWKDTTELSVELREVLEQHETEKKITSIFGDMNDNE